MQAPDSHKRGDSLSFDVEWFDDDVDRDMTGTTATAQMRTADDRLVQTFECTVVTAPGYAKATVKATAAQAREWKPGTHDIDVEFALGDEVFSTSTIKFTVAKDITRPVSP